MSTEKAKPIHYKLSEDKRGLIADCEGDFSYHIHSDELSLAEKHVVVNLGGDCTYYDCEGCGHVGDGDNNGTRCPVCNGKQGD